MDLGLEGHTAIVAGSTSGRGAAVATMLGREGAKVVIAGRRQALAQQLASELPRAIGVGPDLADPTSVETVVSAAKRAFGAGDIVVLNSGGPAPAVDLDEGLLQSGPTALLFRQVDLVASLLPCMRSRPWGRIVAIGCSRVQQPLAGWTTDPPSAPRRVVSRVGQRQEGVES
ncbi:MAG: SDR family NAD(P)-dependent oxidoreductase [Candidatus Dormibacteraeota bacterium]|nr:SDR family NAD(P)-dependent oxidoreductase [Candidatus Dormibacteraeota bacterium]